MSTNSDSYFLGHLTRQYWCFTFQAVSGCSAFLCFKPTDDAFPWLSREWVAAVPCYVSSLLMKPVLHSSEGEWLQCLAVFQAYWWSLSLAIQYVSACSALLGVKPTNDACSWLSSLWVPAMPCNVSSLLMMPVIGSLVCECLQYLAVWQAYWWYLSLALQEVSGCSALLFFKPTDGTCPWVSRLWVTAVPCRVLSLLKMPVLGSSESERLQCLAVF